MQYIRLIFVNVLTCGLCDNASDRKTKEAIRRNCKRAGFTDTQVDVYLAKFKIDTTKGIYPDEAQEMLKHIELRRYDFDPIDITPEDVLDTHADVNEIYAKVNHIDIELKKMRAKQAKVNKLRNERKTQVAEANRQRRIRDSNRRHERKREIDDWRRQEKAIRKADRKMAGGSHA